MNRFGGRYCSQPVARGLVLIVACLAPGMLRAAETPIEDRPYRVRVQISFAATPQFDAAFRTGVLEQLSGGIERSVGSFWRCDVAQEQGGVFSGPPALKRLTPENLMRQLVAAESDKAYLIAVTASGAGIAIAGREWDAATRQLGPVAIRSILDRRELPTALLDLLHELFRPVAEINHQKSGSTSLRPQGENLAPSDSQWPAVEPGKLFEVYNRILDKDLAVERIQQIPWTYLEAATDFSLGPIDCTVISGLRAPIAAKRHRLLPLALGINDRGAETRLTLVTRSPARRALAGVEVELTASLSGKSPADEHSSEPDRDLPVRTLPTLITDRNGKISLSAAYAVENRPIWLFVKSGQVLLARVPYLPGLRPAEVIELPDDSLRLEVEGDIALLQAKLVDTVARRAVLMAQAKARAKAGQFEAAAAALASLEAMPKAAKFVADLNLIRINRTKAARSRRDKSTEERIRKLCLETGELVTNYLDETKLTEVRDEIRELRRVTEDNAAMEAKAQAVPAPAIPEDDKKRKRKTKPGQPTEVGAAEPESVPDANPGDQPANVEPKKKPKTPSDKPVPPPTTGF